MLVVALYSLTWAVNYIASNLICLIRHAARHEVYAQIKSPATPERRWLINYEAISWKHAWNVATNLHTVKSNFGVVDNPKITMNGLKLSQICIWIQSRPGHLGSNLGVAPSTFHIGSLSSSEKPVILPRSAKFGLLRGAVSLEQRHLSLLVLVIFVQTNPRLRTVRSCFFSLVFSPKSVLPVLPVPESFGWIVRKMQFPRSKRMAPLQVLRKGSHSTC